MLKISTQQEGIVLEVIGNIAKVKTSRHNDCDNCGACPGNSAIVLEVQNNIGAQKGQRVMVEVKEANMLKAAFIVYLLPLFAAFVGAILGSLLSTKLNYEPVYLEFAGGGLAFILSIVYIKQYDKSASSNEKMQPVITRILSE